MEFVSEIILLCLIGGFIAIDTTAGWQLMIANPLAACSILGLLMGNFDLGLQMGILMALLWVTEIPVGGAATSEGNIAALISAGIAIHLSKLYPQSENIAIIIAIMWGLTGSILGGQLVRSMRRMNVKFSYQADRAARNADYKQITLLNLAGVAQAYLLGFGLVGILFFFGIIVSTRIVSLIPEFFNNAFGYGKIGLLALGAGLAIRSVMKRSNFHFFILGILISIVAYFIF